MSGVQKLARALGYSEEDVLRLRAFSAKERKKLAARGQAMPDGSYPIVSEQDLKNAIQAFGRAPQGKKAAVRRHILKRARALGATNLIPDGWKT